MPATKLFGEPSRLFQMLDIANVEIYFRYAKEKEEKKALPNIFYGKAKKIIVFE